MKHLRRLLPYLKRHRRSYIAGLALVVLATACGAAMPPLAGHAVDRLRHGAPRDFVATIAGAIVLLALARGVLLFASRYLIQAAARRIEYEMRNDLFAHLETLSARWYDTNSTGEITSRVINDLEGVRMMAGLGTMALASTGLLFGVLLGVMAWHHAALAALSAIPLLGVSAVMAWTGSRMHALSLDVQAQLGTLSARAQENFSGARVVRSFVQEERETDRYRAACGEYRARNLRLARWRAGSWAAILVLAEGAVALTLLIGGNAIIGGSLSRGVLVTFAASQFQLLWPMIAIGWVVSLFQRGSACMGRLAEILDARSETADGPRAAPGLRPIQGRIEARNLTFSYAPDRPPALRDVSFVVEPGRKVAIVGRTGAGKTTLVQLLLRHYPVPEGMLFVDGRDVNDIPLPELRAAFGTVPQDLFLFSDRIRENIAFGGRDGAGDDAILRATEISRLSEDLDRFPDRLDQVIGERGVTLSGGQKQRAAIARAVVREPAILVLDDALSSVDSHTEQEIQQRLREFMKGRTTLVITHRLAAVADADEVLVLDEGRLAERGRPADLVAAGGPYARLWESQRLVEELAGT